MCVATSPPVAIFARGDHRDVIAQALAPKRVVDCDQCVDQWQPDVVGERQRSGARPAFVAIDGDEVRAIAALTHLTAEFADLGG